MQRYVHFPEVERVSLSEAGCVIQAYLDPRHHLHLVHEALLILELMLQLSPLRIHLLDLCMRVAQNRAGMPRV